MRGEDWPSELGHAAPHSARQMPAQSRAPWIITAVAVLIAAASLIALAVRGQRSAEPASVATPVPAEVSASAAQERICNTLKTGYPNVLAAVHASNEFLSAPWSNPDRVRTSNVLARETAELADELEAALTAETPRSLKAAVAEFITGLRAASMSYRDHAADEQINGVGALYNASRHEVLQTCGVED